MAVAGGGGCGWVEVGVAGWGWLGGGGGGWVEVEVDVGVAGWGVPGC